MLNTLACVPEYDFRDPVHINLCLPHTSSRGKEVFIVRATFRMFVRKTIVCPLILHFAISSRAFWILCTHPATQYIAMAVFSNRLSCGKNPRRPGSKHANELAGGGTVTFVLSCHSGSATFLDNFTVTPSSCHAQMCLC